MDKPLDDPTLEAAARIVWIFMNSRSSWDLEKCRAWAKQCPSCARDLMDEAAHQADALRAASAMTPREDVEAVALNADKAAYIAGVHDLPKLEKDWQIVATMLRALLAERDAAFVVVTKYRDAMQSCRCTDGAAAIKEIPDA